MTQFSDFGLKPALEKALAAEGYVTPTPIQSQAIPHAMEGKDILGIAQTGTGKTAAFALPILHRLSGNSTARTPKSVRTLILSPTRELATQIADSFKGYARFMDMKIGVVFGGVPIPRQERMMQSGLDVLVATPGRLLDLCMRRALSLGQIEMLVLDEADQMLDLGFVRDLKKIVNMIPVKRQTLFFSATMPEAIAALAKDYLKNPVQVAVTPVATTAERVTQHVIFSPQARKQGILAALVSDPAVTRTLVFTRTKHGADRVVRQLGQAGIESNAIHGNKSQNARERALAAFRAGHCKVLVATDIAARGIDVDGVSHVINFELPNVAESYVHRIGRTARAGKEGIAISLCADDERSYLRDIEKLTRQRVAIMQSPAPIELSSAQIAAGNAARDRAPHSDRVHQERKPQNNNRRPAAPGTEENGHRRGNGPKRSFRPRTAGGGNAPGGQRSGANTGGQRQPRRES